MAGTKKKKVMKRQGGSVGVAKKRMAKGKKVSMRKGIEHYTDYVKRMFGGGKS